MYVYRFMRARGSIIYTCIQEGSLVRRTFPGLKYRMISGGGIVAPYPGSPSIPDLWTLRRISLNPAG